MSYTSYLVANYSTGLDKRLQPWLTADDAQQELFDGYVYRGTMSKRQGYEYYATGQKGNLPYRESRIVDAQTNKDATQVPNGVTVTFTYSAGDQIARGSVLVTASNPFASARDNGFGVFLPNVGVVGGTVNYLTGAISITFVLPPIVASTVTFTFNAVPDDPVMMVANFIDIFNNKELIVASKRFVNRYNSTNNVLEDLVATPALLGNEPDNSYFFSWVNYPDANSAPRLIFTNNWDPIQQYDGTNVIPYPGKPSGVTDFLASFAVVYKDRLLLLRTTEDGQVFPQRIRISGTGANTDVFDSTATGAGFIDIPDGSWINGATGNRDDILIFTAEATWSLKYTGNDTTPFTLVRLDESRGSDATFSAFTYLNRSSASSRRGLIISDGYTVERQDLSIPDFTFDEVDQDNFNLCFAGAVDADRDHYLIYPEDGFAFSTRILTTNYDEDNYSIYRLPLSCMGTYKVSFDVTWDDLLIYANWDQMAAVYANWNSFAYSRYAPISIGGGHHGEIWDLSTAEGEDNPVKIRNITIIDANTLEVTTDWNNYDINASDNELGADFIYFTGVQGMLEINEKQYPISVEPSNHNVFRIRTDVPTSTFSAYTGGGMASRVIPFTSLFKKFNPYVMNDQKVRCGWLYMYVDSSGTDLTRNIAIIGATQSNPAVITTGTNHGLQTGAQISIFGVGGMTALNNLEPFITVLTPNTFSLNNIDSSAFGLYTGGGYASVAEPAKMRIDIITNDNKEPTQINDGSNVPYEGNFSNLTFQDGSKKWYKLFINQTGQFIQFRFKSLQAGANVNIQATMFGFQPTGRMI